MDNTDHQVSRFVNLIDDGSAWYRCLANGCNWSIETPKGFEDLRTSVVRAGKEHEEMHRLRALCSHETPGTSDYEKHFAEANRMYGMSWEDDRTEEESANLIARAQVHATLALAAATAQGTALDPLVEPMPLGRLEQLRSRVEES